MRETFKNQRIRMNNIVQILKREYPDSKCSLLYDTPFQLLLSTILSAQCTDERVNKVTKKVFEKYPDANSISNLSLSKICQLIYSTGFYNNKANNIKMMSDFVYENYDGKIPPDINSLVKLPGVGRKTANVVLGTYYNIFA